MPAHNVTAISDQGSAAWAAPGKELAVLSAREYANHLKMAGQTNIRVAVSTEGTVIYEINIDGEKKLTVMAV